MYLLQEEPERAGRAGRLSLSLACALCAAVAVLWVAHHHAPAHAPARPEPMVVRMEVAVASEPAPVQPEPEHIEEAPPEPPEQHAPHSPRRVKQARPRRAAPAPEAPATPVPTAPPPPVRLGISLSSAVAGQGGPGFALGEPVHGVAGGVAGAERAQHGAKAAPPKATAAPPVRREASLQAGVTPSYPQAARDGGIEGTVVLALTIGADGRVHEARVLRGLGHGLDEAAIAAARRTRWSPATSDGRAVRSLRRFHVRFTLES